MHLKPKKLEKRFIFFTIILISLLFVRNTYYQKSFEVVIARYNENLDWVQREFPDAKIIIYNKGADDIEPLANWQIIKVPNVGREAHTYLYHIISHYNNLADRTLFLQGDPFDTEPWDHTKTLFMPLKLYETVILNGYSCNNIISRCALEDLHFISRNFDENFSLIFDIKQNDLGLKNKDEHFDDLTPRLVRQKVQFRSNVHYETLLQYIQDTMGKTYPVGTHIGVAWNSQFAVDKEVILRKNQDYYIKIINTLNNINPVEGHFIERTWDIIFAE